MNHLIHRLSTLDHAARQGKDDLLRIALLAQMSMMRKWDLHYVIIAEHSSACALTGMKIVCMALDTMRKWDLHYVIIAEHSSACALTGMKIVCMALDTITIYLVINPSALNVHPISKSKNFHDNDIYSTKNKTCTMTLLYITRLSIYLHNKNTETLV